MATRRTFLADTAVALGALAMVPGGLLAAGRADPLTRAIPATGERLPIIGLGSSATFAQAAAGGDFDALRTVLQRLAESGGRVFDTAPGYGAAEAVAGGLVRELGIANRLFWATKLNVAPRGGRADPEAARRQLDASFERVGKSPIDLVQVHNMGDLDTQLPILREARQDGRIRHIGEPRKTLTQPRPGGILPPAST